MLLKRSYLLSFLSIALVILLLGSSALFLWSEPPGTRQRVPHGCFEIICGPMYAGKTTELFRRLHLAEIAHQEVLCVKHPIDSRDHPTRIISHNGQERSALTLPAGPKGVFALEELAQDADVIGIEEVQFFDPEISSVITRLVQQGKRVIASGLDRDFKGQPFGPVPHLMALADKVDKLTAVCMQCKRAAQCSQRLIDGKPANPDDPLILVGAADFYEPRCHDCFIFNQKKNVVSSRKANQPVKHYDPQEKIKEHDIEAVAG